MPDTGNARPYRTLAGVLVRLGCQFVHQAEQPTHAVWRLEPRTDHPVVLSDERWSVSQELSLSAFQDSYGNRCRRMTLPAGDSTVGYHVITQTSDLPDEDAHEAKGGGAGSAGCWWATGATRSTRPSSRRSAILCCRP